MLEKFIERAQHHLKELGIDGWLIYDFRRVNALGLSLLGVPRDVMVTRRFFYWIPAEGQPVKIVHKVEPDVFAFLPGETLLYSSRAALEIALDRIFEGVKRVAMEYSPDGGVPHVSRVDGGTIDMVRAREIEVVSSADLIVLSQARQDSEMQETHRYAAEVAVGGVHRAWQWIRDHVESGSPISEYDVQDFLMCEFAARGCETEHVPICATNANAANPHYVPTEKKASLIEVGDWILIDLWCRQESPLSMYADLTKVAVVDKEPTERQQEIFSIVLAAQQAAIDLVISRFEEGRPMQGWEIDRACRDVIETAGYGDNFIHRTGHDIGRTLHGPGTQMDDYETHDTRPILPGTCFSIEPGIYFPGEFGVRLECDVLVTPEGKIEITGDPQQEIATLIK